MKVFVVNCGSSSIKYQLFDMADESVLAKGLLERLGTASARLRHASNGRGGRHGRVRKGRPGPGPHRRVEAHPGGAAWTAESGVLDSIDQIDGVGHRVVHGGEAVTGSTRIDEKLLKVIERNCDLAPLHNPANLAGIRAAMGGHRPRGARGRVRHGLSGDAAARTPTATPCRPPGTPTITSAATASTAPATAT